MLTSTQFFRGEAMGLFKIYIMMVMEREATKLKEMHTDQIGKSLIKREFLESFLADSVQKYRKQQMLVFPERVFFSPMLLTLSFHLSSIHISFSKQNAHSATISQTNYLELILIIVQSRELFPEMYSPIQSIEKHTVGQKAQKTRLFRNIRSQITRTMYECECGRRYQTFPALYLHFKRQHSLRISAKAKDQLCSIRELGSYRIVKYFYSLEGYERNQNGVSEQNIQKIISRFLKQMEADAIDKQMASQCLDQLIFDMFDTIFHAITDQEMELISNLPYRLNTFILDRQNILSEIEFGCWCQALIEFFKWLYQNEFTQVLIELNEEYFYPKIVQK